MPSQRMPQHGRRRLKFKAQQPKHPPLLNDVSSKVVAQSIAVTNAKIGLDHGQLRHYQNLRVMLFAALQKSRPELPYSLVQNRGSHCHRSHRRSKATHTKMHMVHAPIYALRMRVFTCPPQLPSVSRA